MRDLNRRIADVRAAFAFGVPDPRYGWGYWFFEQMLYHVDPLKPSALGLYLREHIERSPEWCLLTWALTSAIADAGVAWAQYRLQKISADWHVTQKWFSREGAWGLYVRLGARRVWMLPHKGSTTGWVYWRRSVAGARPHREGLVERLAWILECAPEHSKWWK